MLLISVITPVLPAQSAWLTETWHSLLQQEPEAEHPWAWEWLVQRDGPDPLQEPLPEDDRIRQQVNPVAFGPALARTLALARARGSLVKVLDADDRLTPGQLAREVAVFQRHPQVGWLTAAALDQWPDGRCEAPPWEAPEVAIPIGWVAGWWREHGRRLPVHPASLCVRSALLRALGGWMPCPLPRTPDCCWPSMPWQRAGTWAKRVCFTASGRPSSPPPPCWSRAMPTATTPMPSPSSGPKPSGPGVCAGRRGRPRIRSGSHRSP